METKTDTRERILEAAMERILHYGYAKTTMSEIARDCCMSAGNIYRFYASKLDIAEAMARKFNMEVHQEHARIARQDTPATARLHAIIEYGLKSTFEKLASDAKILEVAEVLTEERPTFANEELAQERIHLVRVLEDGVASGELAPIADPAFTAEMIQTATMKFRYPQLFSRLELPKLERELTGVMQIIDAALKAGIDPPRSQVRE
ncbi:MAG: TetR family transcriptional regulator [Alphaproteobacteria bacterium]|jgi:AcrR family transcriptional regulator|nr:TetR family transcriptional regulator [Alphaproteobacteria bacterium]